MTKTPAKPKTKPKTKRRANPNNANQFKPDPRQTLFLSFYLDPKSKTFSNAYQSAVKAGYGEEYAKVITSIMPTWLKQSIDDNYLVSVAEKNLREMLEMETVIEATTKTGEKIEFDDPKMKKIKADMTKFTLERLSKEKYSPTKNLNHSGGMAIGNLDLKESPEALKTLLKTSMTVLINNLDEEEE